MTTDASGPNLQETDTIESERVRPANPQGSIPTKTLEVDATAAAIIAEPNAGPAPLTVQTIQHYELIRRLGEGGMGTVYLARDTKLGRLVAIKLLIEITGASAARFLVEARATARCKHENIVVIHEVGEHDGYPYMVLEHIDGQSLHDWMNQRRIEVSGNMIKNEPVPAELAIELMLPVVRALRCAHALGIVHRDLKPGNIMLDASGPIKVLDFGIAKVREAPLQNATPHGDGSAPSDVGLTHQGMILGTLPYMSPEQWQHHEVDARSDIWAVGIMLFELVAGVHPLAPLTFEKCSEVGVLETPMPSVFAACPDVGPLGEVIDRCLNKCLAERMGSADELRAALEALLPGQRSFEPLRSRASFHSDPGANEASQRRGSVDIDADTRDASITTSNRSAVSTDIQTPDKPTDTDAQSKAKTAERATARRWGALLAAVGILVVAGGVIFDLINTSSTPESEASGERFGSAPAPIALGSGGADGNRPLTRSTEAQAFALLTEAQAYIVQNGMEKAFVEFNRLDSPFNVKSEMNPNGDLYLYTVDFEGYQAVHGKNPKIRGKFMLEMQDKNKVSIIKEMAAQCKRERKGTLAYEWPNPITDIVEHKVGIHERIPGTEICLGTGIYH